MSSIKGTDLKTALLKKGFKITKEGKHTTFYLYDENNLKTSIHTHLSHSFLEGNKEMNDYLISNIKNQMHLNKREFLKYVECTLSIDEYYDILKSDNSI